MKYKIARKDKYDNGDEDGILVDPIDPISTHLSNVVSDESLREDIVATYWINLSVNDRVDAWFNHREKKLRGKVERFCKVRDGDLRKYRSCYNRSE